MPALHKPPSEHATVIFTETKLKGAFVIELERRDDERGFFARSFCRQEMQSELGTAKQDAEQASVKATEFASLFASLNAEVEKANAQLASADNVSADLKSSGGAQQPAETFGPNKQPPALYVDTPDMSALATAHVSVGMAQGNFAEALESYRDGLAVASRLAKAEPENPEWQNKIALISRSETFSWLRAISPRLLNCTGKD